MPQESLQRVDPQNSQKRQEQKRYDSSDGMHQKEQPAVKYIARNRYTGKNYRRGRMRTPHPHIAQKKAEKKRLDHVGLLLDKHGRRAGKRRHTEADKAEFTQRKDIREHTRNKIQPIFYYLKRSAKRTNCNLSQYCGEYAVEAQHNHNTGPECKRDGKSLNRPLAYRKR